MAKKNNKRNSDVLQAKKDLKNSTSKKINPFEIHQNKQKFKILGRKCKHDHGLPGVSRGKALKKRQELLGEEFETHQKTNKFIDRRINGIFNQNSEDIANARFTAEQLQQFKKRKNDLYNLNDDEVLTHKGVTLEEVEQFNDLNSEDEDDDEVLDAEFTDAVHFGGGTGLSTDRKAAIDEMISNAKRKKAEIMREKNEIADLTIKLDEDYKKLIPLMGKYSKNNDYQKQIPDSYDRALKEMIFEPRGEVTDRLQSEEELAKKEKERLETLENERLARMKDYIEEKRPKHRSADDLDDGYFAGSDFEDETTLAYDLKDKRNKKAKNNHHENEDKSDNESDLENKSGDSCSDDDENSEEEEEDNLSDLKVTDSESENENENNLILEKTEISDPQLKSLKSSKLPFTYDMPMNYDKFTELLSEQTEDNQNLIIQRIIKCNHPSLDATNNDKMVQLFGYIIAYINERFTNVSIDDIARSFKLLDVMVPHLFDLINLNAQKISTKLIDIIKQKYNEYKQNTKKMPNLDTIVLFKIVSNLYSTSDFRHPVVTPCFIFISHILSQALMKNRKDIACGLFIVTIALEFAQLSKRFLPAVLNFLLGIMFLSVPKRKIEIIKIIPPFQSTGQYSNILVLDVPMKHNYDEITEERLEARDLVQMDIDEKFKILSLNTGFKLVHDFIGMLNDNVGVCYLAEPFLNISEKLNLENYPSFVQSNWEATKNLLVQSINKTLHKLVAIPRKPKALRLWEPRIEKIYDDKRRPKMSKDKEMRAIMIHKIKRETKGAVREIRRDNEFLQNIKIQKQIQSDMERKEKVRRIYAEAAEQQGEYNAMTRKRKKGKF